MAKVGVLIISTVNYTQFIPNLLEGINKFFLKNHDVTIFLHTDKLDYPVDKNMVIVPVVHNPWPHMTLDRYAIFAANHECYKDMDFLYYIDADSKVIAPIGDEILGPLMGVITFSYDGKFCSRQKIFEVNEKSTAYVAPDESFLYFVGGFQGGSRLQYLEACRVLAANIYTDLQNDIIARFHDESHWNRYLNDNISMVVKLSPDYAYPEPLPALCKGRTRVEFIRKIIKEFPKNLADDAIRV